MSRPSLFWAASLGTGTVLLSVLLAAAPSPMPSPPLEEELATVDSLRSHRQFGTAVAMLDSLANQHPNRVGLQWRRALLHTDLGKVTEGKDAAIAHYKEAKAMADTAIRMDSTSAHAHLCAALTAGRLTLHVGRSRRITLSRAVKRHADRAIALDSTLAGAYHLRGRWHREVADLNFITRTLVKALYGGLPDASYEQAIRDFNHAIARESKPYNHLELAKTYLALGREDDARAQLRVALETAGSPFDREHKQEAGVLLTQLR